MRKNFCSCSNEESAENEVARTRLCRRQIRFSNDGVAVIGAGIFSVRCLSLTIGFDNSEKRLYDVRPLLKKGTVFEPFMIFENFKRVYVDEQHTVSWDINPDVDSNTVWSNKVDLCPDSCYIDSKPI